MCGPQRIVVGNFGPTKDPAVDRKKAEAEVSIATDQCSVEKLDEDSERSWVPSPRFGVKEGEGSDAPHR